MRGPQHGARKDANRLKTAAYRFLKNRICAFSFSEKQNRSKANFAPTWLPLLDSNQRSGLQNGRTARFRSHFSLLPSALRLPPSATGGGRLSICSLFPAFVQFAKWSHCSLLLAFLPFAKRPSPPFLRLRRRSAFHLLAFSCFRPACKMVVFLPPGRNPPFC